jgi:hypothetical protein
MPDDRALQDNGDMLTGPIVVVRHVPVELRARIDFDTFATSIPLMSCSRSCSVKLPDSTIASYGYQPTGMMVLAGM